MGNESLPSAQGRQVIQKEAVAVTFPLNPEAIILVYDTETTSLPLFKEPSEHPGQPKILQLCGLLVDSRGNKLSSMDCLLRWPGVVIDDEAFKAHGITAEKSEKHGIDPNDAMHLFLAMWRRATLRVAHNEKFDARLVRIHQKQHPGIWTEAECDLWKDGTAACTQNLTKPIMKLPPTERMKQTRFANSFKSPNLREAYFWATGKEIQNAHNAMYDVMACKSVFFAVEHFLKKQAQENGLTDSPKAPAEPMAPEGGPEPVDNPPPAEPSKAQEAASPTGYDW
jgi:DNA polymerase-3 subunit epsilon